MKRALEYIFLFLGIEALAGSLIGALLPEQTVLALLAPNIIILVLFIIIKAFPLRTSYRMKWADLSLFILLAIATLAPSLWMGDIGPQPSHELQQMMKTVMASPLGVIDITLLAPLVEEIVFRGAIERSLLSWHPFDARPWAAILLSAAFFGIAHLDLSQGIHAFLIGILLGWIYWRTSSILPGLIVHIVNNTSAYAISLFYPDEDATFQDIVGGDIAVSALLCVLSVILLATTILLLRQRLIARQAPQK